MESSGGTWTGFRFQPLLHYPQTHPGAAKVWIFTCCSVESCFLGTILNLHICYQKCEKQFSHDVNFKTQHAHHSQGQETVHVCHYCQKEFQHLGHYKEHLRKHTGEKPFKCPICHENYGRKSSLKVHLQVCNSVEGAKKGRRKIFVCQVCETSFQRWENFKDHLISHTGKKPYYCPDCDKWFMCPAEFQEHCHSNHEQPDITHKQEASNTDPKTAIVKDK